MMRLLALTLAVVLSGEASGPSLAEASSHYATLDGHKVHYKTLGSGKETIVFVHGWTCDLGVWRFQAPAFAKDRRVIAIDLPGHGGSDAPEIDYTMGLFARSIDAVMREERVSKAVLVGHSMGTPVVREFYRLYPEKTAALVAVDGSFRVLADDPAAREKFLAPFRGPDYREALARFAEFSFPPDQAALRDSVKAEMMKTPQHVLVSAAQNMLDAANFRDDPIRVPLLNVLAKSPYWSADYEAFVRNLAPGVDYQVMDGVGHFLMLQKPEEFNAMLSAFLAKKRG